MHLEDYCTIQGKESDCPSTPLNSRVGLKWGLSSTSLQKETYCRNSASAITFSDCSLWMPQFRSDSLTSYRGFQARCEVISKSCKWLRFMCFSILGKHWSSKRNFRFLSSDHGLDRNLNPAVAIYERDILTVELFPPLESYEWTVKLLWKDTMLSCGWLKNTFE